MDRTGQLFDVNLHRRGRRQETQPEDRGSSYRQAYWSPTIVSQHRFGPGQLSRSNPGRQGSLSHSGLHREEPRSGNTSGRLAESRRRISPPSVGNNSKSRSKGSGTDPARHRLQPSHDCQPQPSRTPPGTNGGALQTRVVLLRPSEARTRYQQGDRLVQFPHEFRLTPRSASRRSAGPESSCPVLLAKLS